MIESSPAISSNSISLRGLPSVRISRIAILALVIKLASAGVALALRISLARVLGHVGYGEFAYVFAWLQLTLIFAHGGFATAALRYVAEYRARCQPALLRGFLTRSFQMTLFESVIIALLMAGCATALHPSDSTRSAANFLFASAALPFLSQLLLGTAVVRGLGHVIASMLVTLTHPLLLLGALLTIAHWARCQISSSSALLLNLGAAIGALGVFFALWRHFEQQLDCGSDRTFLTGEWLGTATQMMLASSLVYIQGRTGVLISGLLLDAQAAGTYAAIERLADAALLGLASVNMLAAPKFAVLHAQGQRLQLQLYARLAAWGASGLMLATALPLALFGKSVLRCFGEEFVSGYSVLLVLLGGASVNALCGSVGLLLSMTGHHRRLLCILAISLSINLGLSFLLVPRYGIIGSAWANTIAVLLWNVVALYAVRVHLGIWPIVGRLDSNKII